MILSVIAFMIFSKAQLDWSLDKSTLSINSAEISRAITCLYKGIAILVCFIGKRSGYFFVLSNITGAFLSQVGTSGSSSRLLRFSTAASSIRSLFSCIFSLFGACFGPALALRNGSVHECLLFFGCCISEMFDYLGEYFFLSRHRVREHINLSFRGLPCRFAVSRQHLAQIARLGAVESVSKKQRRGIAYAAVAELIVEKTLLTPERRYRHTVGIYLRLRSLRTREWNMEVYTKS